MHSKWESLWSLDNDIDTVAAGTDHVTSLSYDDSLGFSMASEQLRTFSLFAL